MSAVSKYAGLPDLDLAPDTYETPELTDDASTHPTSTTLRSDSPDHDQDDDETDDIDRHRLDPAEARTHFLPADERDANPSSRISSKRKSYRSSSRKRQKDGVELNGLINGLDISSDEEKESLERKLVRLHREVSEAKEEYEQIEKQKKDDPAPEQQGEIETLDNLSHVLGSIGPSTAAGANGAASRLTTRLVSSSKPKEHSSDEMWTERPHQNGDSSTYTVSYVPRYQEGHTLSRVSDFDSRLTLIEAALGIDAIPLPTQDRPAVKAVIPSLDTLDKQLTTLTNSTDLSLDGIGRKVRQLTQDAEKLERARKSAKAAQEPPRQEALSPSNTNFRPTTARDVQNYSNMDDPESTSKVNALYGTLSTIESLAPILPSVLDRLRSLRSLHADAATASQNLVKVESGQEDMKQELQEWREGLEKVEKAMEQGEQIVKGNTEMVEGWVKELEDRMRKLGQ